MPITSTRLYKLFAFFVEIRCTLTCIVHLYIGCLLAYLAAAAAAVDVVSELDYYFSFVRRIYFTLKLVLKNNVDSCAIDALGEFGWNARSPSEIIRIKSLKWYCANAKAWQNTYNVNGDKYTSNIAIIISVHRKLDGILPPQQQNSMTMCHFMEKTKASENKSKYIGQRIMKM